MAKDTDTVCMKKQNGYRHIFGDRASVVKMYFTAIAISRQVFCGIKGPHSEASLLELVAYHDCV